MPKTPHPEPSVMALCISINLNHDQMLSNSWVTRYEYRVESLKTPLCLGRALISLTNQYFGCSQKQDHVKCIKMHPFFLPRSQSDRSTGYENTLTLGCLWNVQMCFKGHRNTRLCSTCVLFSRHETDLTVQPTQKQHVEALCFGVHIMSRQPAFLLPSVSSWTS